MFKMLQMKDCKFMVEWFSPKKLQWSLIGGMQGLREFMKEQMKLTEWSQ
jgi:hypothetical protein